MKNRLILFKTFTNNVEHGENNEINRNIENLLTIALWEFCWLKGCACYHGNSKKNIENDINKGF